MSTTSEDAFVVAERSSVDPIALPYERICHSNDDQWLEERQGGIGCSEVAILFGPEVQPYESVVSLWGRKTGLLPPIQASEHMRWARRLEEQILRGFGEDTGRQTRSWQELLRSRREPRLLGTPDGIQEVDGMPPGLVEIKLPDKDNFKSWVDEPPFMYRIQLQAQLALTGFSWGSVVALVGGNRLVVHDIPRSESTIRNLFGKVHDFWGYVEREERPPFDPGEQALNALKAIYPVDDGTHMELPDDAFEWDLERQHLLGEKRRVDRRLKELESLFAAAIEEAAFGHVPGSDIVFGYPVEKRKGYTVEPTEYRRLRRKVIKDNDLL